MEFFEFLFVTGLTVILPITIVAQVLKHRRWQTEMKQGTLSDADGSLSLGELKEMVKESVHEANQPLLKRIEKLEKQQKLIKASPDYGLLDSLDPEVVEEPISKSLGRQNIS